MSEQSKPKKVRKTIQIECPDDSGKLDHPKVKATQIIYWDGTIEVKCLCGYKKII